jgi:hypothetical protein
MKVMTVTLECQVHMSMCSIAALLFTDDLIAAKLRRAGVEPIISSSNIGVRLILQAICLEADSAFPWRMHSNHACMLFPELVSGKMDIVRSMQATR